MARFSAVEGKYSAIRRVDVLKGEIALGTNGCPLFPMYTDSIEIIMTFHGWSVQGPPTLIHTTGSYSRKLRLASQLPEKGQSRRGPLQVEVHGSHRQSPPRHLLVADDALFCSAVQLLPSLSMLSCLP